VTYLRAEVGEVSMAAAGGVAADAAEILAEVAGEFPCRDIMGAGSIMAAGIMVMAIEGTTTIITTITIRPIIIT